MQATPPSSDAPSPESAFYETLQQIRRLEQEYWQGWQQSEQAARDLRFLDGVQWCIERRMRLLQLDKLAPARHQAAEAAEEPIVFTLNLAPPERHATS
jgi:hypothetical protein